jgi:hypothetical protein
VRRDCRRFRLCLCVIVIFMCESSVHGNDRLQGIYILFLRDLMFICESSVCGEDRQQGI